MAKLVINPTSASKKEIPLARRALSIGRDPSNDLVLSDSMVSRRHAILEPSNDDYILRDNNSSNGTLVNGDRVDKEQTLRDGDLVAIGAARLLFQLDEGVDGGSSGSLAAAFSKPASTDPASSTVGEEIERCPGCGRPTLRGDRFCRGCGRRLSEGASAVDCSRCGAKVPLPADFCGHCGALISASGQPSKGRAGSGTDDAALGRFQPSARRGRPEVRPRAAARESTSAGFGVRLLAGLIDAMILATPALVATLISGALAVGGSADEAGGFPVGALFALSLGLPLLSFGYHVYFWAARGATPGKSLVGLVVCTETGETPIGYPRAVARAIGYGISSLPFGLGFLWIAFGDGRGWHDHIAATRVSRVD